MSMLTHHYNSCCKRCLVRLFRHFKLLRTLFLTKLNPLKSTAQLVYLIVCSQQTRGALGLLSLGVVSIDPHFTQDNHQSLIARHSAPLSLFAPSLFTLTDTHSPCLFLGDCFPERGCYFSAKMKTNTKQIPKMKGFENQIPKQFFTNPYIPTF